MMRHSSRLALLPVTALALNGCIAAALPALAGGAILNSGGSGSSSTERTTANPVDKSSPLERGIAPSAVDAELGAHPALNEGFASFAQFARERGVLHVVVPAKREGMRATLVLLTKSVDRLGSSARRSHGDGDISRPSIEYIRTRSSTSR